MTHKPLKIAFTDFWKGFDPHDNFFTEALNDVICTEVCPPDNDVDILFYSCFGSQDHFRYRRPIRIYFSGENDVPNFNECDYAISFHDIHFHNRHIRLPLYCVYDEFAAMTHGDRISCEKPFERDFCSAVISNAGPDSDQTRLRFLAQLGKYKTVASGGRYANNVGDPVPDKIAFISKYKFNIAFENCRVSGYTTEKLLEPLYAGTVPIYYGNPDAASDFNPRCFININDFNNFDDAIDYIKKVDNDESLYMSYFNEDPLSGSTTIHWQQQLASFLSNAIQAGKQISPYGRQLRFFNRADTGNKFTRNKIIIKLNRHIFGPDHEIEI